MKRAKSPAVRKLFGTDGIRGVANIEPITSEVALRLGRAAAHVFKTRPGRHRIVIGKDTRLSGYMIESALTSGICSMGVDVLLVGPLPTPAISFLARSLRADAGVMISASHNAYEDNGIKFFSRDGLKLPDEQERQIEELVLSKRIDALRPTASEIGKAFRIDDAEGRYIEFVKQSLHKGFDLEGMAIVVDCAHGAAYKVAPDIYRELGARVTVLGDKPDGTNINRDCGAVHPQMLQEAVKAQGLAEAMAMSKRAEAFRSYNEAAVAQMFIDKLPELAQAVTAPLSKIDKIVMVNTGGDGIGASKLTGEVTNIIAQVPPVIEAMTGIKLQDLVKSIPGLSKPAIEVKPNGADQQPEPSPVAIVESTLRE